MSFYQINFGEFLRGPLRKDGFSSINLRKVRKDMRITPCMYLFNVKLCIKRNHPKSERLSRPKAGFQRVSPRLDFPHVSNWLTLGTPSEKAGDLEVPKLFWAFPEVQGMFVIEKKWAASRFDEVTESKSRRCAQGPDAYSAFRLHRIQRCFHRTTHLRPAAPRGSI